LYLTYRCFDESQKVEYSAGHSLNELWTVLEASQTGRKVDLVSIGIDAFTTCLRNYVVIIQKWAHLSITLVVVVPRDFPGTKSSFPVFSNGIRYGTFSLSDIARAVEEDVSISAAVDEFVSICKRVNLGKEQQVG
jgi:hypothetical protein